MQRDTYTIRFYRFRSLLEKKFVNGRSVEAYSKILSTSSGFLNKICKQFCGLSAQQMIHYKLIPEIKKQLYQNKSTKEKRTSSHKKTFISEGFFYYL